MPQPAPVIGTDDLGAILATELAEVADGSSPADPARVIDAVMFDRLVLGRAADPAALEDYRRRTDGRTVRQFLFENLPGDAGQRCYPHVPCVSREMMWEREDGLRIWFNLRDLAVGLQICQGTFDTEVERVLTALVEPGTRALDIGANLGFFTLVMARAGARVRSFEAFPYNHGLLERNVAENRLEQVVSTRNVACGEASGTGRVCFDATTTDLGEMFVPADGGAVPDGWDAVEVPLARVDDLVPEDEPVHVVKMDVEGSELDVLRGMTRILERDRPVIVLELNSWTLRGHRGVEPGELMRFLFARGYRAAEAGSMLGPEPVWVPDLPDGAHLVANIVCWAG